MVETRSSTSTELPVPYAMDDMAGVVRQYIRHTHTYTIQTHTRTYTRKHTHTYNRIEIAPRVPSLCHPVVNATPHGYLRTNTCTKELAHGHYPSIYSSIHRMATIHRRHNDIPCAIGMWIHCLIFPLRIHRQALSTRKYIGTIARNNTHIAHQKNVKGRSREMLCLPLWMPFPRTHRKMPEMWKFGTVSISCNLQDY